ncbi:MAG: pyruvate dehydrogenase (acetyl-transferring) E1 component subunit alpha [Acidilobaceae archaeon]
MENPFREYSLSDLGFDLSRALGLYRVINVDGMPITGREPSLSSDLLLNMYIFMVRARILDEWILKLQRIGKVALHAPNKGQEAVAVGSAMALDRDDWLFPSYRELGAYLARGMSEEEILDRSMINIDDPLRGSEFAIYGHRRYNIIPAPVPVGSQIPLAVGAAIAAKILKHKTVTMAIFGDGATSRADFHVGLNFAGVFKAPVVLVIQNNQWAISTPAIRQTASRTFAIKGVAYNIPSVRIDGNDILAVYTTALEAVERARTGEGPTLIEAVTYRLGPHTTADDPTRYRSKEEVEFFEKLDPIPRFRKYLILKGIMTESEDKRIWEEWSAKIEDIVKNCYNKPQLPVEVIFENVYSKPTWNLLEQQEELKESLRLIDELGLGAE